MIRAARAATPAMTIAVGLLVSIVATATASGGASALVVVRAAVLPVLLLAIAGVLGPVALTASPTTGEARRGTLLDRAAIAAGVWTVAAAVTAFLLYLGAAPDPSSPAFGPGLVSFVADVAIGRTWLIEAAAAAVLTALLVAIRTRRGAGALLVLAALAVVPVALQQGMDTATVDVARTLSSGAFVQLVALATWLGAAALRTAPVLRSACFAAVGVATLVALPDLAQQGLPFPLAVAAGAGVLIAGLAAVAAAAGRLPRLIAVLEPVVLAASMALGVAASATASLPEVAARSTPAEILTGEPLPAPPSVVALLGSWRPDPLWTVVAVALLVVFLVSPDRRFGGDGRSAARAASWIAGVVLLLWLTNGGPARYAALDLGVHLGQHLALLLVVPLLLAAGAPDRLLAVVPAALPPVTVTLAALVGLGALYATDVLRWSVTDAAGTETVLVGCVVLGVLLVRSLLRPGPSRRSAIVCAVLLLGIETGAAALLATGSSLLLADWYGALGWGTDALAAQRLGALLAWPVAAVPTVVLLVSAVRAPRTARAPLSRPATARS